MRALCFSRLFSGFLIIIACNTAHAGMDRWQVMAMKDRYAEQNPETLGKPAAPAVVPGATPLKMVRPTLSAPTSPTKPALIPPPPIPASPAAPEKVEPINTTSHSPPVVQAPPLIAPKNIPVPQQTYGPNDRLPPTVANLRRAAHELADKKLVYKFGSDEVDNGGLDCSATVQYLLSERLGIKGVPRTSYLQYEWLEKKGTLNKLRGKRASDKLLRQLSPGDLIFWGKTWSSGHKVSHVMIYMGWNPNNGKHYVFGARGKRVKGLTGAGVDVFELNPDRGVLVGHGSVPGLL